MCISNDNKSDDMAKFNSCKVAMYNDQDLAMKSAVNRDPLRQATNFAMVIFDDSVYFQKGGLICLILFAYLPMLVSTIPLFTPIADCILKK